MKILLIVDLQNDFCPGGTLAVQDGDKIIPIINKLIDSKEFDFIIASKDWHPANHVSFAANHSGKADFETISLDGHPQTLWPRHCVQNTPGAEFHPKLNADKINYVIHKGAKKEIDSYSAFYDNLGKYQTGLNKLLADICEKAKIPGEDLEIYVCGLALDYCVKFSALDAAALGFNTKLIYDATRAVALNPNDEKDTLIQLKNAGVDVVTSREVLKIEVPRQVSERNLGITL